MNHTQCCPSPNVESEGSDLVCVNCGFVHGESHEAILHDQPESSSSTSTQYIRSHLDYSKPITNLTASVCAALHLNNCVQEAVQIAIDYKANCACKTRGIVAASVFLVARRKGIVISHLDLAKHVELKADARQVLVIARKIRLVLKLDPLEVVDTAQWLELGANAIFYKDGNHASLEGTMEYARFLTRLAFVGELCETKTSAPVSAAALILGFIAETSAPLSKPQKQRLLQSLQCTEQTSNKRCADFVNLIRQELENNALPWYAKDYIGKTSQNLQGSVTGTEKTKAVTKSYLGSKAFCVKLSAVIKDLRRVSTSEGEAGEAEQDKE
ncbi:UNVERIFIED_CONTAM: hypothetical protein HDU68_006147 [Siphonaria sp. JEL0065]|nr:hypothetical protein HDU68_006147 [Siphonaria sp. JEL0065]